MSPGSATTNQTLYLKGTGSSFNSAGWQNIFYLDNAQQAANPSVWHLVYSGNNIAAVSDMQITFTNGEVFTWTPDMGFSTNAGGNNPGWIIVAPCDWVIAYIDRGNNNVSGSFLVTEETDSVNFNVSGFHKGTPDAVEPVYFTVTYNPNNIAANSVDFEVLAGELYTVLGAENVAFEVPFGYLFVGWNTQADGLGTSYAANACFMVNDDVVLYAIWERLTIVDLTADFKFTTIGTGSNTVGTATVTLTFEISNGDTETETVVIDDIKGNPNSYTEYFQKNSYSFVGWQIDTRVSVVVERFNQVQINIISPSANIVGRVDLLPPL
ncbi:MAG: InlB B-repeat-containing protein [Nitrososphaerota archaeon]|nr:InlB B-repeat-containing protein [Nitrososphaerota archaeon]